MHHNRHGFFALVSRMKNIDRWALMRNSSRENVQEHSHMVAVIAHALAVIRRDVFGEPSDPGAAAAAALFHDASEIITGDMPTPVKYHSETIKAAYGGVEAEARARLLGALPDALRPAYEDVLTCGGAAALVKAADKIAAYIKCVEELNAGNGEFRSAAAQTREKISALGMPEADYFMEHFIPAFSLTLDEILAFGGTDAGSGPGEQIPGV
ncbi:MAG: 5'-deoxynucleotidase [Oscillospiraceae bacterium]|jgi:5'-deoxynucleotidase|nr:5'-deoxynucleotidase [Oscillospiraceae bacterium]